MTAPDGVLDLVQRWAGAEEKNDAGALDGLLAGGLEEYFEKLAPILAEHRPAAEYYQLAEDYGITIQDDWIDELERTYGVKL